MSARADALALKRQQLLVEAAVQRVQIAYFTEQLHGPLSVADRVMATAAAVRRHPLAVAVVIGFLLAISRRRLVGLAGKGWALWRLFRMVSRPRPRRPSGLRALIARFVFPGR